MQIKTKLLITGAVGLSLLWLVACGDGPTSKETLAHDTQRTEAPLTEAPADTDGEATTDNEATTDEWATGEENGTAADGTDAPIEETTASPVDEPTEAPEETEKEAVGPPTPDTEAETETETEDPEIELPFVPF